MMNEDNELIAGRIYETIVETQPVGRTLYLGKSSNKKIGGRHVVAFRGDTNAECWLFADHSLVGKREEYSVNGERLLIKHYSLHNLSKSETQYFEQRLTRVGL